MHSFSNLYAYNYCTVCITLIFRLHSKIKSNANAPSTIPKGGQKNIRKNGEQGQIERYSPWGTE